MLSRGYSIVFDQNKKIINNSENLTVDDKISIKFYHGNTQAKIIAPLKDKKDQSK
ncbi:MAG TPA: hypothetical protein DHV86_07900 [Methylophilaceae bacterium]|nr:hypothetical protein [Methylophilaceae bacterium]